MVAFVAGSTLVAKTLSGHGHGHPVYVGFTVMRPGAPKSPSEGFSSCPMSSATCAEFAADQSITGSCGASVVVRTREQAIRDRITTKDALVFIALSEEDLAGIYWMIWEAMMTMSGAKAFPYWLDYWGSLSGSTQKLHHK